MICAIKDTYNNVYFCSRTTEYCWYHPDISRARFFTDRKFAQQTIDSGDQHVIWPGNRVLVIVEVEMKVVNPKETNNA